MAALTKKNTTLLFLPHIGVFAALVVAVVGKYCDCREGLCCSKWGYCGTDIAYCGSGCQSGPCSPDYLPATNETVFDAVTKIFGAVTKIFGKEHYEHNNDPKCVGYSFYSKENFLEALALESYPMFREERVLVAKCEIVEFFAFVMYKTYGFCIIEEINGTSWDYCDKTNKEYPCVAGKAYYGRGPAQLTGNDLYGEAGEYIGFDGLKEPEKVANDPLISFRTALWFYLTYEGRGFHPLDKQLFLYCYHQLSRVLDVTCPY